MAQEFHISVTPLGEDEYLVRLERVAPGVPLAEEQVRWPIEDWLAQARQLMNDPLMGLLQGNEAFAEDVFFLSEWDEPISPSSRNLAELGHQLYNALFQGSLRDSWMMAQAIAQNQRQVLRLRLGLKGTRLPRLPWEVLHAGDRPLATGTDVAFSRYQLNTRLWRPNQPFLPKLNQPLKILMVISGPSDQDTLELVQEASHLQEELRSRSPNEPPAIQLTILEQPGREQLTQALEQGQYQIFHYAGHSNLGESGGDVYLVSNKTGLTETLNGDDLAGLLVNNGVQVAVFNSCRGAYTAASGGRGPNNGKDRNLAEALVKRGIPGVLAMAERIPDEVALTLTRLLYRNLNQGYPIDLSLSRARQGLISAYGSNQLYWALPVLYLHPEFDGFLTNETPQNQDKRLDLPEMTDTPLPRVQEVRFTPPELPSLSFSSEDENEPDGFLGEGGEDSEADDPSLFIKNLLSQLAPEPVDTESVPPSDGENRPSAVSQEASWELGAPPPNPTPASETELASRATQAPTANPNERKPSKGLTLWWQKLRRLPKLWLILGATGLLAIALLGFWLFQNRGPQPGELIAEPGSSIPGLPQDPNSQNLDGKTGDTATITNLAIEQFSRGNIAAGQKAVEVLLEKGQLPQAQAALDAVSLAKLDDPAVSYLRGRLAWQAIQAGSRDYEISDARRYWETAHKAKSNSVEYLTALGFAYYAEGNYERANNAWFDALTLIQNNQAGANVPQNSAKTVRKEDLNIYAGLALGTWKSAQKPTTNQTSLLSTSRNMRQYVMTNDPVNFQPEALSKNNWLWTEKAIEDWRSLLATNN
ncbi:MAG: CHAT domain-containing protein [Cyanobacteriota bacterium]